MMTKKLSKLLVLLSVALGACGSSPSETALIPADADVVATTSEPASFKDVFEGEPIVVDELTPTDVALAIEPLIAAGSDSVLLATQRSTSLTLNESGVVGDGNGNYIDSFNLQSPTDLTIEFSGQNGYFFPFSLGIQGGANFLLWGPIGSDAVLINYSGWYDPRSAVDSTLSVWNGDQLVISPETSGDTNTLSVTGSFQPGDYLVIVSAINGSEAPYLLSITSAEPTPASNFTADLVQVATQEWDFFGRTTIVNGSITNRGFSEIDEGYWQRVGDYWLEGTGTNKTGLDRDWAWSAAFISWVMKEAGAGANFVYSIRHSDYITEAIANRKAGQTNAPFVGYRLDEVAPEVGDLVCYARETWVNYDTTGNYPSHCDIVTAVRSSQIDVIGGNVSHSVTKKTVNIDDQGLVDDPYHRWFTVIKQNL